MLILEDGSQVNKVPVNYTGWFIDEYGDKNWYQDGKQHRLDGPAWEEYEGSKAWYHDDKLHRLDGPAIEWADGTKNWRINDRTISKQTRIICIL
jgi:hypothetical protein